MEAFQKERKSRTCKYRLEGMLSLNMTFEEGKEPVYSRLFPIQGNFVNTSCFWMEDVYKRQALMGACAERNISLCYMTPQGKFLARVTGKVKGNVILREQQYASSKNEEQSLEIARNCILGKVHNARWVLERCV